jgi:transposase
MSRVRLIKISDKERKSLEQGLRTSDNHGFRRRCELVLLKSEGRSSQQVAAIVKMHPVTVSHWLSRYEQDGLEGLKIKPGRGRKPILDADKDVVIVRKAVEKERQRLKQAKLIIEKELHKEMSLKTIKRFLKALTADINE